MKKLLAALLLSTPLAVALPAAAKWQDVGTITPASEKSDEGKDKSRDGEKKDLIVSEGDKDKSKGDEEKKDLLASDGDKDKEKTDGERKDLQA